jgi:hypothetical protein
MMFIDKNYQHYLSLKEKLNFVHKGIQYNKVLAADIGRIVFFKDKPDTLRGILRNLFYSVDMSPLIQACATNKKIAIYSLDRDDYKYQVEQTIANISSAETILIEKLDKKISFNPIRILTTFFFTYKSLKGIESLYKILFLTSKIVFYRNIHEQLFSILTVKPKKEIKLISFNSAYCIENLICQFFNLNHYPTFSLSHGFFVPYKKFIPIDIINGENIVANKILVWGSASVEDLNNNYNFPKESVLIAGNPKYPQKEISIKQTFRKGIVLLGRAIYHESNLEIIEILKKFSIDMPMINFSLKLHPSLSIEIYKEICEGTTIIVLEENKSLFNIFKENIYDFSIVNNSTTYYEAMYADMICLRYELSENEDFKGLNDKFTDSETLKKRIQYFTTIDNNKLNSEVEALLNSILGMGINNYKQILD